MESHDMQRIEAHLRTLSQDASGILTDKDLRMLLATIRKPGWTTVAEVAFVGGILEAMIEQSKVMAGLKHALLSGSAQVALNPQPLPPEAEQTL